MFLHNIVKFMGYKKIVILLSFPQAFGIWGLLMTLVSNIPEEDLNSGTKLLLSLTPFLMGGFIGAFILLLCMAFYLLIWFWLEPIIYFSYLKITKQQPLQPWHTYKKVSYLLIPILFIIFFMLSPNAPSNSTDTQSSPSPKFQINIRPNS